jgi:hypothetical protein
MDYYLIDFNKENNYSFDNVIIGKKIHCSTTENIFKYYIYYYEDLILKSSPKTIYIKIPRIRLIYKLGQNIYNQERIVLYPNYNLLHSFIDFIKDFEENISSCIKNKYSNLELSSILIKNSLNNSYSLKINVDDKIKISSTLNNSIQLKDFKINNEIELVMKINYIWIKDNNFGINCSLYQIKYYPSLQDLNIDLIDQISNINVIENSTNNLILTTNNTNHTNNSGNSSNINNFGNSGNSGNSGNLGNSGNINNTNNTNNSGNSGNTNNTSNSSNSMMSRMIPSIDVLINAKNKLKPLN